MTAKLREGLERHGLLADKRFGQHFLLDLNLTRKIAGLAAPLEGAHVLEVGPGPGGLTRALLEGGAARVVAVEKDRRFMPLLRELEAEWDGRLQIVEADALRLDLAALFGPERDRFKVVSNLPYNVGSPLLAGWLTEPPEPREMVLMFQREVADRIVAPPGSAAFGRLSVLVQTTCTARLALAVPARAFTPPPKVESAVVLLKRRSDGPSPDILKALEAVTGAAFGQRRKMLRSSLRALGGDALCSAAGVSPELRAEALDLEGFLRLARIRAASGSGGPPLSSI